MRKALQLELCWNKNSNKDMYEIWGYHDNEGLDGLGLYIV